MNRLLSELAEFLILIGGDFLFLVVAHLTPKKHSLVALLCGILLGTLILGNLSVIAWAEPINVRADLSSQHISHRLSYFKEDSTADQAIPIEEMLAIPPDQWRSLHANPNFGSTKDTYWFSAELTAKEDYQGVIEIDRPMLDDVSVYLVVEPASKDLSHLSTEKAKPLSANITYYRLGDRVPFATRPVVHNNIIVPLDMSAGKTVRLLMRVNSGGIFLQFEAQLWRDQDFYPHVLRQYILHGLFFGALLLVAFYNLFIFFSVREPAYFFLVGHTLTVGLATAIVLGYAYQYLWPENPTLNSQSLAIIAPVYRIFVFLFCLRFLQLSKRLAWAAILLKVFISIDLLFLLAYPFDIYTKLYVLFGIPNLIAYPIALLSGAILWWKGFKEARFYTVAWIAYVVTWIIYIFEIYGFIEYSPIHLNRFMLSQLSESILFALALALALADRLNIARENAIELQKVGEQAAADAQMLLETRVQLMQTEMERIEQEQKAKQEHLANQAKSEFLSNMSHEIRTPMNAILGFSELMLTEEDVPNQMKEDLAIINSSGEYLLSLINDVLEMSKIEAGHIVIRPDHFDVYALLQDLQLMFSERCDKHQLSLSVAHNDNVPQYLYTDSGKLRQIIINLLGNAVKFTPQGGIALRADAHRQDDDLIRLIIEVEDTGVGVSEEDRGKVFGSFEQTQCGVASGQGAGLGLSISREYARMMNGDIAFTSQPDQGSIFRVEISCQLGQSEAIASPQTIRHPIALQAGQPRYRILIVDDQQSNRLLLERILSPPGF